MKYTLPLLKDLSRCATATASLLAVLASAPASAAIVSDDFTGIDGALIEGRSPDGDNLPGSAWEDANQSSADVFGDPRIDTSANGSVTSARLSTDVGIAISIASTGSYTKPAQLAVSANLRTFSTASTALTGRGVGIGFLPEPQSQAGGSRANFDGVLLRPDGELVIIDGTGDPDIFTEVDSFTIDNFDIAAFYTIAFNIDTTSGNISDVTLNGNATGLTGSGIFTDAGTANLAAIISGPGGGEIGYIDAISVAVVPEPGSLALIGLAGAAACGRRRR